MSVSASTPRRGWHPVIGSVLVAVPCVPAVYAAGAGAPAPFAGLTAFLVMGAVAGFSVSGST